MAGDVETTAAVAVSDTHRVLPPTFDTADIDIAVPPQLPGPHTGATLARLAPAVMAVVMVAALAVGYRSGSTVTRSPLLLAFPGLTLVSVIATVVSGRRGRPSADADRDDYLDYLAGLRRSATRTAAAQRASLTWRHPPPDGLWTLIGGPRMWERQPDDPDFGAVRVGLGEAPLATRLVAPTSERAQRPDPVTATALRRFVATHSTVPAVPAVLALFGSGAVSLQGDRAAARALTRAMVCQLAVLHGPHRVRIAAVIADRNLDHWDWLKWLPHHQHPSAHDAVGPARLMYPTFVAAEAALAGLTVDQQLVLIVDGGADGDPERIVAARRTGGTTLLLVGADGAGPVTATDTRLRVSATALLADRSGEPPSLGTPDRLDLTEALVCARRLAGYRPADTGSGSSIRWADLAGIDDVTRFDPAGRWRQLRPADRLRVPIGVAASGAAVHLDIKEAAENGMGPHGLCIGATGSGKSELLRTIVLGMMARHSPEELNLVLVDFKGGATFLGMSRARHVAAVITNLADEAPLVARMRDALAGELNRRQELLRAAGDFTHAGAYRAARSAGAPLEPLPTLFVVVDEFSELLSQHPDFVDMFVAIGRLGRSLSVHLLLASQRLEEGRLRGLESHLSYRICLKTLSASESRLVLGAPDAHQLPNTPGAAYLRDCSGELVRFQAAFVSGPVPEAPSSAELPAAVRPFTALPSGGVGTGKRDPAGGAVERTVLHTVLDRLAGHGPPARQVWLAPLEESPTLDGLLAEFPPAELVVPIGLVDRPFEQRRTALLVDLRGAAGNVAVVGGPQSGKSTTLATLVSALTASCDAVRVQLYCLDFGGGALAALQWLPQVGSVSGRGEPDLVRRTVGQIESILASREQRFRDHGISSMHQYRLLRTEQGGACDGDRFGDVFLVIDGWAGLCREFDALESSIVALAVRGLSFGVHVVLSASRWAEIRPALRDQIGSRIELRLGDPADSELDRGQAQLVPRDKPGRGLTDGGLHALIALPRLTAVGPLRSGAAVAPPVPLLPARVHRRDVVDLAGDGAGKPLLGLDERDLRPVAVPFSRQPHLLILGDTECGKTAALRTLCAELMRTATPAQAQLVVVDYRRSLLGVVEAEYLGGYAISAAAVSAVLPALLDRLAQRMPGPQITAQQLRDASWWSGPQLYLLVDDYDLVATAAGNPLVPLLEYLPHAVDIGLHLVIARRSGGAARAMYEPLLAALRDLGCMALVMSGNADEGPLLGSARPVPLPPGRGTLITRSGGEQLVQVAWSPPP